MTEPHPASFVVVDVGQFGRLTNPQQLATRASLYRWLIDGFTTGGVQWESCQHEDRGDGVLVVAPASVAKTTLLGPVLDRLTEHVPFGHARLAVHAGEMHHDGRGFVGADVNTVFRLVNSDVSRRALAATTGSCVVLVSDQLYQGIVQHGYRDIRPTDYRQVSISEKETNTSAWLRTPGDPHTAERIARQSHQPRRPGGVTMHVGGDQTITGSTIIGGDMVPRRRR
ncbi:adenylate/guanylate cyclase [Actinocrispum wychmicini]|nr:adenylate/guanylate cyclase [Actinocrispum wychmicini]